MSMSIRTLIHMTTIMVTDMTTAMITATVMTTPRLRPAR